MSFNFTPTFEDQRRIARRVGLEIWQAVATYDTARKKVTKNYPTANSVVDLETKLGAISRTFIMRYDIDYGSRSYCYDYGSIYPFGDFEDQKIFSVIATKENLEALEMFFRDRDDTTSARRLRELFPEFLPRKSCVRRLRDYLFGAA